MYTLKAELKAEKYKENLIKDIQFLQCELNMEESKYTDLKDIVIRYLESLKKELAEKYLIIL